MKIKFVSFPILLVVIIVFSSCAKKKLNESLYEESIAADLVLYQSKDSILSAAGTSPHGKFKLKFNTLAASQFGADGKFPAGGVFQDGSLIVKEVYAGTVLSQYAIMKKDDSKFSGSGWLWAEYDTQGNTVYSVGNKGAECTGCHSGNPNRDMSLSFDLH